MNREKEPRAEAGAQQTEKPTRRLTWSNRKEARWSKRTLARKAGRRNMRLLNVCVCVFSL